MRKKLHIKWFIQLNCSWITIDQHWLIGMPFQIESHVWTMSMLVIELFWCGLLLHATMTTILARDQWLLCCAVSQLWYVLIMATHLYLFRIQSNNRLIYRTPITFTEVMGIKWWSQSRVSKLSILSNSSVESMEDTTRKREEMSIETVTVENFCDCSKLFLELEFFSFFSFQFSFSPFSVSLCFDDVYQFDRIFVMLLFWFAFAFVCSMYQ